MSCCCNFLEQNFCGPVWQSKQSYRTLSFSLLDLLSVCFNFNVNTEMWLCILIGCSVWPTQQINFPSSKNELFFSFSLRMCDRFECAITVNMIHSFDSSNHSHETHTHTHFYTVSHSWLRSREQCICILLWWVDESCSMAEMSVFSIDEVSCCEIIEVAEVCIKLPLKTCLTQLRRS